MLRRRPGESIAIGADIEIEVMEISRTRVKLGVRAPREIPVLRKETLAVAAENRQALELVSAFSTAHNGPSACASGTRGVAETLRLLAAAANQEKTLEFAPAAPICFAGDIPGIPNEAPLASDVSRNRENPEPRQDAGPLSL